VHWWVRRALVKVRFFEGKNAAMQFHWSKATWIDFRRSRPIWFAVK